MPARFLWFGGTKRKQIPAESSSLEQKRKRVEELQQIADDTKNQVLNAMKKKQGVAPLASLEIKLDDDPGAHPVHSNQVSFIFTAEIGGEVVEVQQAQRIDHVLQRRAVALPP
eukprot:63721-Karenia_brevis.AAC.1